MIVYYMYKNMILVFCEMWFATNCGYSGQRYWSPTLISLYNGVLTTFQSFMALYFEASNADPNHPMVLPSQYRATISSAYVNAGYFFLWTFNSFFHGTLTYFLVTYSYSDVVDSNGVLVDY
jgi:magnesium-transporting ATPase (P-type)